MSMIWSLVLFAFIGSILCFSTPVFAENQNDEIMKKVVIPCFMHRARKVMNVVMWRKSQGMYEARYGVKFRQKDIAWQLIKRSKKEVNKMLASLESLKWETKEFRENMYRSSLRLCTGDMFYTSGPAD